MIWVSTFWSITNDNSAPPPVTVANPAYIVDHRHRTHRFRQGVVAAPAVLIGLGLLSELLRWLWQ